MEKIELYHGTNTIFDSFKNEYLATKDSIDQYGSGFYFYSVKSKTTMHGDFRVYADAWIMKSIPHDSMFEFTFDQVHSFICLCSDLDTHLTNYGDIDFEGFETVLNKAVNSYTNMPFLDALNSLGNDFFPTDCHILLNAFVKETGINCITDLSRDIYVMLRKTDIEIKKVIPEQDDI